jgi:hypothetical protein
MLQMAKRLLNCILAGKASITWIRSSSDAWLAQWCRDGLPLLTLPIFKQIKELAACTDSLGPQRLWDGYESLAGLTRRRPREVQTEHRMGILFASLVMARKPERVVEIGSAFGVSGMYWLAGFRRSRAGTYAQSAIALSSPRESLKTPSTPR